MIMDEIKKITEVISVQPLEPVTQIIPEKITE
jgi:hypothetical protein